MKIGRPITNALRADSPISLAISRAAALSALLYWAAASIGCSGGLLPCAANPTGSGDTDGDGYADQQEFNGLPGSDPCNPRDTPLNVIDSDGDGCSDFDETTFTGFCDDNPTSFVAPPEPDAQAIFELTVARHATVRMQVAEIDARLREAGFLLQANDSNCPDRSADVTFVRAGEVEVLDLGAGIVTSEAQLDALFSEPFDFKIVDMMIGVCGSSPDDAGVLIGCASGSVVITARAAADVWAHEWGHVLGLGHRDDCPQNLMHATEINTDAVNEFERSVFLRDASGKRELWALPLVETGDLPLGISSDHRGAAALNFAESKAGGRAEASWPSSQDLELRLAGRYRSGIPLPASPMVTADDAQQLLHVLHAAQGPMRTNAIRMLGFCGAAAAGPARAALQSTVLDCGGELSEPEMAATAEALLALGRMCRAQADPQTLAWLQAGTDPSVWGQREVHWTFRGVQPHNRGELLARLSILALSLTDSREALAHLRLLQQRAAGGDPVCAALADQISEAIAVLEGNPRYVWNRPAPVP